jgi:dolichyldiphosphatase
VYLHYHTVEQVLVGAVIGVLLGTGAFAAQKKWLEPLFPAIEESWLGRWFYFKDSAHLPNVLQFEYENARRLRKNPPSSSAPSKKHK